jgi:4-amino-4-deoxy-L-arabinose transferase-like glycosyltransferase
MNRNKRNTDSSIALLLVLLGLIARIPFVSRVIFEGDSARFALAMIDFDVTQMRPHAPGYVLYVGVAKLFDLFIQNEQISLISVSVVSSAFALGALYFLVLRMFGRTTGVICCLLLLSSPLFWFNGEMPLTYALEGLFIILFAYACFRSLSGEGKWLLYSALLIGIATGVRQNLFFIFLPFWIFALVKHPWKRILSACVVFGITCAAWFIPLVELSGGFQKYFATLKAQYSTWVIYPASFIHQLKGRGLILLKFMVWSLTLGLLPMFYALGHFFRIPRVFKDQRLQLILLWSIPPALFYVGVSLFNPGLVVVMLPPLFIFLAESLKVLSADIEEGIKSALKDLGARSQRFLKPLSSSKNIMIGAVVVLIFFNVFTFFFGDTQVSYSSIKNKDLQFSEFVRLTRENTQQERTAIFTFIYNTQASYYLPDYLVYCPFPLMFSDDEVPLEAQNVYKSYKYQIEPKTYWIPTGFQIEPISLPAGIDTLIIWESDVAGYYEDTIRPLEEIEAEKQKIYRLKINPGEKIYYDYHYWTVK